VRTLAEQRHAKALSERQSEFARKSAEYEATIRKHQEAALGYENRLKADGRVDKSEYQKAVEEADNWRKIAAGMEDPRIKEFSDKHGTLQKELEAAQKEIAQYKEKQAEAEFRRMVDANPVLKSKEGMDSFIAMVELGWDDEAAVDLAGMSVTQRQKALEFANRYKLGPGQHKLATEFVKGQSVKPSGPSDGALAVGDPKPSDEKPYRNSGPVDMDEARRRAAANAVRAAGGRK
jgi:hypothetical protein